MKKCQIKYDEEVFSQQWSKEHFEFQKLQTYAKELEEELSLLRKKQSKDKEKRNEIEKRIIELEQVSGLWNVKAEAYEGEVGLMTKRVHKLERRMSQTKLTATRVAS